MKKGIRGFLVLSGISFLNFFAPGASAGGFYLQEQSASAIGTAFAGASAMARDASIIYYNPAGMTALNGGQLYAGVSAIAPWSDLSDDGSTLLGAPISGTDSDNPTPLSIVPSFYIAYPVYEDRVWAGLGVSVPFGLATKYKSNWFGRYDAVKSTLITTDIAPSIAVKVNDWLSLGAGMDIQYADAELTSVVTNGVTEGLSKLTGDDWSVGYNAGVLMKPFEDTTVGIHYRSRMFHTLEGRIEVTGVAGLNENTPGTADLNLPDVVSTAVVHELNDRWTVMGQANWFGWNQFEGVKAVRGTNNTVASNVTYDYGTTWSFGVGAEYEWDQKTMLRFGYEYDETPSTDRDRSARVPDGDRNMFAAGLTYDISPAASVDFGGMYTLISDESIAVSRNAGFAQVKLNRDDSGFAILSVGLSYKF